MGNFLIVNNSADRIRRLLAEPSNQRWIMENLSAGSVLLSQRLHRQSRKGPLHSRGRNRHRCCASSGRAHRMLAEQPVRNFLCGQTCSESGRACPRPLTGRFFVKPLGKVFSWVEAGDVCLLSRERKLSTALAPTCWRARFQQTYPCKPHKGRHTIRIPQTGHPQGAPHHTALPLPLREARYANPGTVRSADSHTYP